MSIHKLQLKSVHFKSEDSWAILISLKIVVLVVVLKSTIILKEMGIAQTGPHKMNGL